jgi:hypothetical protein
MHIEKPAGTMIQARYKLRRVLGQGGSGITYEAEDCFTGRIVALKELSLRGLNDWKKLELFEREAKVLKSLDHPAIPDYVDYFQVDTLDDRTFYIAQELAEGASLAALVAAGERFDELEVRRIARAILDVLVYLHELTPPIIHRDIKPQNIIRREDGQIYLVDFGAVQTVYRDTMAFGSTVVGTYGYMAPEQFRGQAYPVTDLYGLGTTLLNLLTHESPGNLPQVRLKIDFRQAVTLSEGFANWLEGLIEPYQEDRYGSAAAALSALDHPVRRSRSQAPLTRRDVGAVTAPQKPTNTRIRLERGPGHQLRLELPPMGLHGQTVGLGCFALFWNGFLVFWTGGAMMAALSGAWFFPLFSIPFWVVGIGMAGATLFSAAGSTQLFTEGDRLILRRKLLGWQQSHDGNIRDLDRVELRTAYSQNNRPVKVITLLAGTRTYKFGTMLSAAEKAWLVSELEDYILDLPGR